MSATDAPELRNRTTLLLALVAVASLIAGSEWVRVFGWGGVAAKLAVAALIPALIVRLLGGRRSLAVTGGLSIVAMIWFTAVAVLHDSVVLVIPTPSAIDGIYQGIISGWSGILSLPLTVSGSAQLLVFPCVLVWVSCMVGCEIVRRTRAPLAGMMPPVAAFIAALCFGIGSGGYRVVSALLLAATVMLAAGATARPLLQPESGATAHAAGTGRKTVELLVLGVIGLIVGVLAGTSVPVIASGRPYDPRADRIPPTQPFQTINPLAQLGLWATQAPHDVMTVQASLPESLRLVVLPTWDPVDGWTTSSSSTFYRIGTGVPAPDLSPGHVLSGDLAVTQRVHITALAGPWLPAAVRPVSVTGVQALVEPSTGELIAASGHAVGTTYTVVSSAPSGTPDGRADAPGGTPIITGIPADIQAQALSLTQGEATPWGKALALEHAMTVGAPGVSFAFQKGGPTGTNIQVMHNFLVGKTQSARKGTPEQFAGGFALLAESLNLPTRVVVAFHSVTAVNGVQHITTREAFAADEVQFADIGWVLFDPTPHQVNAPLPPDERLKGHTTITSQTPAVPSGRPLTQGHQATPPSVPHTSTAIEILGVLAVLVGAVLLIVGGTALLVGTVRRRRTRRRRTAVSASERVIGAWIESIILMRDLGPPAPRSDTAMELAMVGADRLGAADSGELQPLAEIANATLFSTWEPDDDAALEAWGHTDRVAEQIGERLGRRGRLRRALDIRVLFSR